MKKTIIEKQNPILIENDSGKFPISINKVYGYTKQNTSILPEGYTQLDYIESNGNQYINAITTNINKVLKFETEIKWDNDITTRQNMGGDYGQFFGIQNGKYQIGTNIISNATPSVDSFDKLTGIFDAPNSSQSITINGNLYSYARNSWQNQPFNLFRIGPGVSSYYCKCKLKYFKIYTDNELIRHYIPCKNSNNEVGLYDLITKSFYASEGTASFIAGNEVSVPNPDYPQPIENVEGRSCTNLFSLTQEDFENGENLGQGKKVTLRLKPNTQYTCSSNDNTSTGTATNIWFNGNVSATNGVFINHPITATTDENGDLFIAIRRGEISKFFDGTFWIQLNEGSTALPYEPYFEGKRLEFNVCNKNIAKEEFDQYLQIQASGSDRTLAVSRYKISQIVKVKPNTTYVIDGDFSKFTDGNCRARCFNEYPALGKIDLSTPFAYNNTRFSITTDSSTKYLMIYDSQDNKNINIPEMFVCEANAAIPYEEHKEQMIPFPLQENQKLMEGDYLAEDGVHHVRGQVVFDGTGYWNKDVSQDNLIDYFYRDNTFQKVNRSNIDSVLCNYFKKGTLASQGFWATSVFGITINKTFTGIVAEDSKTERINKFKNWLSNHNVILEYDLEQETIDPYTPAQAEAYNKLQRIKLENDGIIHILAEDNDVKLDVSYVSDEDSTESVIHPAWAEKNGNKFFPITHSRALLGGISSKAYNINDGVYFNDWDNVVDNGLYYDQNGINRPDLGINTYPDNLLIEVRNVKGRYVRQEVSMFNTELFTSDERNVVGYIRDRYARIGNYQQDGSIEWGDWTLIMNLSNGGLVYSEDISSRAGRRSLTVPGIISKDQLLNKTIYVKSIIAGVEGTLTMNINNTGEMPVISYASGASTSTFQEGWIAEGQIYSLSWNGTSYVLVGAGGSGGSGHKIMDSSGNIMTQRNYMKFLNANVTDDDENEITTVELKSDGFVQSSDESNKDWVTMTQSEFEEARTQGLLVNGTVYNVIDDNSPISTCTSTPVGGIMLWFGLPNKIPGNYVLCEGQLIDAKEYPVYADRYGNTYGGDGINTVGVPNMKGRVVVHLDSNQTEFDTLGETGGNKSTTLTVNNLPEHSHKISGASTGSSGSKTFILSNLGTTGDQASISDTSSVGTGQSFSNVQPYIVGYYIIKVKGEGYTEDLENLDRKVEMLKSNGSGNRALFDDGTYKEVVADTWNVQDEVTNAPSIRLINELVQNIRAGIEDYVKSFVISIQDIMQYTLPDGTQTDIDPGIFDQIYSTYDDPNNEIFPSIKLVYYSNNSNAYYTFGVTSVATYYNSGIYVMNFGYVNNYVTPAEAKSLILSKENDIIYVGPNGHNSSNNQGGGASACFTEDTKVYTSEGLKDISEINLGDLVLSLNKETNEKELKPVDKVVTHTVDKIYAINLDAEIIESSWSHPFYTENRGKVLAKDLVSGDLLKCYDDRLIEIKSIDIIDKSEEVYEIRVQDNNNYYVGTNSVLVYNEDSVIKDGGDINVSL